MLGMILNTTDFPEWLQIELDKRDWSQATWHMRLVSAGQWSISCSIVKTYPQPDTLQAIARAFKIPVETVYRAAGLLPQENEAETFEAEIVHKYN